MQPYPEALGPPSLANAISGSKGGHRLGSLTSTPVTSSLRAHLRKRRKPERPNKYVWGSGASLSHLGRDAAQAGEQGTKSKRSWNALETTAAFGIPLPAVQPWRGGEGGGRREGGLRGLSFSLGKTNPPFLSQEADPGVDGETKTNGKKPLT